MLAFGTNQGEELTNCKHHPKYIWDSKDHKHLLRHLHCCSYEKIMIPKRFFLFLLKLPGKNLELLKPVRVGEEWNRKSALYIGSCCTDAEAEENPLKGKPETEPEKKFNWHPAKSSVNPFHGAQYRNCSLHHRKRKPFHGYKIKTFSCFSFQKDILLDR